MADLIVKPVETKAEQKQFFNLPWQLYKDDPYWIPPLRQNQMELLNYKRHAYYEENKIQTFLASRGGQTVGRIAAVTNHAHNRQQKENLGFFGFFESVDDQQVAAGQHLTEIIHQHARAGRSRKAAAEVGKS